MDASHAPKNMPFTSAACALLVGFLPLTAVAKKPVCAPASLAQRQIVDTIHTLFEAARADDMAKFNSVASTDFYAYDAGKLFQGPALMNFIQQAHAAGKVFEWNVTDPKVHFSCDLAWVTYVNKGAVQDSSGRQEVTWLESAILEYRDSHWVIQFLHSSRAPASG